MYKINKKILLNYFNIRGLFFSKKLTQRHKKHTVVYLRSPKHFNIGKHKVFSFNNTNKILINLKLTLPIVILLKNSLFFFTILEKFLNYKLLFRFNSIRVNTKITIKF